MACAGNVDAFIVCILDDDENGLFRTDAGDPLTSEEDERVAGLSV